MMSNVRDGLNKMVLAADSCIKDAFRIGSDWWNWQDNDPTYRRTRYEHSHVETFTYLPLDESRVPWDDPKSLATFWEIAVEKREIEREEDRLGLEMYSRKRDEEQRKVTDRQHKREAKLIGDGIWGAH